MTMPFELWDTQSGNCLGDYDTEAEVLAVVHSALNQYGSELVSHLQIITSDTDDETAQPLAVVKGPELIAFFTNITPTRHAYA